MVGVLTPSSASLDGCEGLEGKDQLSCIEERYPEQYRRVEDGCASDERPRDCRREKYAVEGISFTPRSPAPDGEGERAGGRRAHRPERAADTENTAQPSDAAPAPRYLTRRFIGAQIGPGKAGGANWDGTGNISPGAAAAVTALITGGTSLAASTVSGELAATALNTAVQGTAAPDVTGFVYASGTTTKSLAATAGTPIALATTSQMVDDSYTPTFIYRAEYYNWPVFADTRFEVSLWDVDFSENDPIGVVQIGAAAVLDALAKGTILEVPVADQCSGQIINIKVSVSAGAGAGSPSTLNGTPFG